MHIMEGFLPGPWWQFWMVVSIPVIGYGVYRLNHLIAEKREILPLLAVAGAYIFVLSSLKLPSVTGSCSHPTGTGMAAILFGPAITALLGVIVLLYQSLFLAHGGLTTLGANVFSMGIAGPVVAYMLYRIGMKAHLDFYVTVFLATALADLSTYIITSGQLALAFPAQTGGALASFKAFAAIFALTQVPLAIMEGAVTALIFKYVIQVRSDVILKLEVISEATMLKLRGMSG